MNPNRKALVIQPGAVGDVILTLPLVRYLRRERGLNRVDLMGHTQRLQYLLNRTEIAQILDMERVPLHKLFEDTPETSWDEQDELVKLFKPYELIITYLYDPKGRFERNLIYVANMTHPADVITLPLRPPADYQGHVAAFYIESFNSQIPDESPEISVSPWLQIPFISQLEPDSQRAREILASHLGTDSNNVIILHPGSGGEAKCWPLQNFTELSKRLKNHGFNPILLLGPAEKDRWDTAKIKALESEVPVIKGLSLEEVLCLLTACTAYAGNDSGITHLAASLGLPGVAVFNPQNSNHWTPLGDRIKLCKTENPAKDNWPTVQNVLENLLESL